MARREPFLTAQEEQEVVQAIGEAERNTSGEIRVHLEATAPTDPLIRAQEIFQTLEMHNTKEKNGVLIYVAVNDKKFAICGDRGIDQVVPQGFWNTTKDLMASHFRKGAFKQGLIAGILSAGKELKAHFPRDDNDTNELSDAISQD